VIQQSATHLDAAQLVATNATSATTTTITPPAGQYVYINNVEITNCAGTVITAAAPTTITTTNLGGAAWTLGSGSTAGLCQPSPASGSFVAGLQERGARHGGDLRPADLHRDAVRPALRLLLLRALTQGEPWPLRTATSTSSPLTRPSRTVSRRPDDLLRLGHHRGGIGDRVPQGATDAGGGGRQRPGRLQVALRERSGAGRQRDRGRDAGGDGGAHGGERAAQAALVTDAHLDAAIAAQFNYFIVPL
jgi:hypothetical protein